MSNQANGFQGSQPFISDNEYKSLPLDFLKYIFSQKKQVLKDNYKELSEKEKIIRDIRKVDKLTEKVKKGIDIKKKIKKERKKFKPKKIKSFDEYFEECIKNKKIPKDTPRYFRKALERAIKEHEQVFDKDIKEYDQELVKEKSALEDFANKYIIKGEPGISPIEFLNKYYNTLEKFFTYNRNIKFNMLLVCLMEQQILSKDKGVVGLKQDKAYFTSGIHKKLISTEVDKLIDKCFKRIIETMLLKDFVDVI